MRKVCRILDDLEGDARIPDLEQLAREVNLTKHHFHRLFKRETGLTPRQYALSARKLHGTPSESEASSALTPLDPMETGMQMPLQFVDDSFDLSSLSPLPKEDDVDITADLESFVVFYSMVQTVCGFLLVAFQKQHVCKLELGVSGPELLDSLERSFPSLYYLHSPIENASGDRAVKYQYHVDAIAQALANPGGQAMDVQWPLDQNDFLSAGV